jgi:sortase A
MKRYHHEHSTKRERRLRRVNRLMLVVIIALNGYILLAPLWPNVSYRIKTATTQPLAENDFSTLDRSKNHVVIPRLRLDEPIYDNADPKTLDLGVWLRPNTSTPDQGSNTVLTGHRWLYQNPSSAVFYNLDKVKQDDSIVVVWSGKIYVYTVNDIKTVPPTAIEVEGPTDNDTLTVYTCTPLWTATDRLVLSASLKEVL